MQEQFVGQVQAFAFDYPPLGWIECEGQTLPIPDHQRLFSLLGNTYGGDSRLRFGVPDLRKLGEEQGLAYCLVAAEDALYPGFRYSNQNYNVVLGEILTFPFIHAPAGSPQCEGQILEAKDYVSAAERLGNRYGGDGKVTFGVPNLESLRKQHKLRYCIALEGIFPGEPGNGPYRLEPFLGQTEAFALGYPPPGWLPCEGQTLDVTKNQALFSLLGSRFGGDGSSTYALPDLRRASERDKVLYCLATYGVYPTRA